MKQYWWNNEPKHYKLTTVTEKMIYNLIRTNKLSINNIETIYNPKETFKNTDLKMLLIREFGV